MIEQQPTVVEEDDAAMDYQPIRTEVGGSSRMQNWPELVAI